MEQLLRPLRLTLLVQPTLWPLFDDAILIGSAGRMRSSRLGLRSEVTTDLLGAAPDALLAAAQTLWGNASLPNASATATSVAVYDDVGWCIARCDAGDVGASGDVYGTFFCKHWWRRL